MNKVFWLALIGMIFGILGAVGEASVQIYHESLANPPLGMSLYVDAAVAVIFFAVGFAGGVFEKRKCSEQL